MTLLVKLFYEVTFSKRHLKRDRKLNRKSHALRKVYQKKKSILLYRLSLDTAYLIGVLQF